MTQSKCIEIDQNWTLQSNDMNANGHVTHGSVRSRSSNDITVNILPSVDGASNFNRCQSQPELVGGGNVEVRRRSKSIPWVMANITGKIRRKFSKTSLKELDEYDGYGHFYLKFF